MQTSKRDIAYSTRELLEIVGEHIMGLKPGADFTETIQPPSYHIHHMLGMVLIKLQAREDYVHLEIDPSEDVERWFANVLIGDTANEGWAYHKDINIALLTALCDAVDLPPHYGWDHQHRQHKEASITQERSLTQDWQPG